MDYAPLEAGMFGLPIFESLEARELYSATPVISEFMAKNGETLLDGFGKSSDWIEIFNPSGESIELGGYYLTDDSGDLRMWEFPSTALGAGEYLVVFASDKDLAVSGGELHTNFKLSGDMDYLALVEPDGVTVASVYDDLVGVQHRDISFGRVSETLLADVVLIDAGDVARYFIPENNDLGKSWAGVGFDDSGWLSGPTGIGYETSGGGTYDDLIETETPTFVGGVYIRQSFTVSEASEIVNLEFQMKYDDGYLLYLNGVEIRAVNTVDGFASGYDGRAYDHWDVQAMAYQSFDLSAYRHLLVDGENVISIHGMNVGSSSSDLLFVPRLIGQMRVVVGNATEGYMASPTPGAENIASGPIMSELTRNPPAPSEHEDLPITVKVVDSGNGIAGVKLHYRIGYGEVQTVDMNDLGTGGDWVVGDGIYLGVIPSSMYDEGDMVRWYVTSEDGGGRVSRGPFFTDHLGTSQSAEYFGTVVRDDGIVTGLPVFQWFTSDTVGSHTRGGARSSVFYNGRFYDNLFVRQRGGATNGWVSQKFNFNKGEKFYVNETVGWVDQINLNGHGVDRSYVKQQLAFETYIGAGQLAPISFNLYMRVNGVFDRVGNFTENVDEIFIKRNGLDADGDVYKMIQKRQRGITHPSFTFDGGDGIERKTGDESDLSEFEALTLGLERSDLGGRRDYIFDRLNIANMVNYVALHTLLAEADDTRKNLYLYHDRLGSGEWYVIPWDEDFTMGYAGDAGLFYGHPFHADKVHRKANAEQWNQLFEVLFNTPETREMYLTRLRTLMDELLTENVGAFESRANAIYDLADAHPGARASGLTQLLKYFGDRRDSARLGLYTTYSEERLDGATIPGAYDRATAGVTIGEIVYNPASGNQDEEYIEIKNENEFAIDVSGWVVKGGVDYRFESGTVILAGGSVYLTPSAKAFRGRGSGVSGGQGLFVQGGYRGHLSNFGETIGVYRADGVTLSAQKAYAGDPSPVQVHLKVTEVNYHPTGPSVAESGGGVVSGDEFEFVELFNASSSETLDLTGVKLSDGSGVIFTFGSVNLAPLDRILVVANRGSFELRYGAGKNIAGEFIAGAKLSNRSDLIKLDDALNSTILSFTYKDGANDSWPRGADGRGQSLQVVDVSGDYGDSGNWRGSYGFLGTPGGEDVLRGGVLINEVLTHTDAPREDQIELYNPTVGAIDLGGWFISDGADNFFKYRIPEGTVIGAKGYVVLTETDFNFNNSSDPNNAFAKGFGLSGAHGDELWLLSDEGAGGTYLYSDHVVFDAAFNIASADGSGTSLGRLGGVDTGDKLVHLERDTLGGINSGHKVSDVIISELMYDPAGVDAGLEYIELYNQSDGVVDLTGWRLDKGVKYDFPSSTLLGADEVLLVVGFDVSDLTLLNRFKSVYGVGGGVQILGGFTGSLNNGGERVRLERADSPPSNEPGYTPRITMDEVGYEAVSPWAVGAAGGGKSLSRVYSNSYGDVAKSWAGLLPTPGVKNTGGWLVTPGDVNHDDVVDWADLSIVKGGMGSIYDLGDLFDVRNYFNRPVVAQAAALGGRVEAMGTEAVAENAGAEGVNRAVEIGEKVEAVAAVNVGNDDVFGVEPFEDLLFESLGDGGVEVVALLSEGDGFVGRAEGLGDMVVLGDAGVTLRVSEEVVGLSDLLAGPDDEVDALSLI